MRMVGNIWKGRGIDAIHIDLLGIKHHHHALLLLELELLERRPWRWLMDGVSEGGIR